MRPQGLSLISLGTSLAFSGRSRTWPTLASTRYWSPKKRASVRALAGDSTMTSGLDMRSAPTLPLPPRRQEPAREVAGDESSQLQIQQFCEQIGRRPAGVGDQIVHRQPAALSQDPDERRHGVVACRRGRRKRPAEFVEHVGGSLDEPRAVAQEGVAALVGPAPDVARYDHDVASLLGGHARRDERPALL